MQYGQRPGESDSDFRQRKDTEETQSATATAGIVLILVLAALWVFKIIWKILDRLLAYVIKPKWIRVAVLIIISLVTLFVIDYRMDIAKAKADKLKQEAARQKTAKKVAKKVVKHRKPKSDPAPVLVKESVESAEPAKETKADL